MLWVCNEMPAPEDFSASQAGGSPDSMPGHLAEPTQTPMPSSGARQDTPSPEGPASGSLELLAQRLWGPS